MNTYALKGSGINPNTAKTFMVFQQQDLECRATIKHGMQGLLGDNSIKECKLLEVGELELIDHDIWEATSTKGDNTECG